MAQASSSSSVTGSERKARPGFEATGPAPADEEVRVVVKVRAQRELADPDALGAVRPSERAPRDAADGDRDDEGAAQADIDAVTAFAGRHGLHVEESDRSARMVILTAPVSAMSAAFGTDLQIFRSMATGETYRGRTDAVHVPDDLEGIVTVVTGLDNRQQMRPHTRNWTIAGQTITSYTPIELAKLYSFPDDLDGTGQCVALLEFGGGFQPSDLEAYAQYLGVTMPKVVAVKAGSQNAPGSDADGEVVLDIDVVMGAAPGAKIAVYFGNFTAAGWVEAITKAVHDKRHRPSVISISWGWPEFEAAGDFAWTDQVMADTNATLKEAAARGITVIVAAGDDGSVDGITDDGKVHVDFPASSPYVVACGGTTLTAHNGVLQNEVVWSNGVRQQGALHGSTGGGISEKFAIPDWQKNSAAGVPVSATTGFVGRGVPDVAAVADARTGYQMWLNGTLEPNGGTSASAPLWAALVARLNQDLAARGKGPMGYWNPFLYNSLGGTAAFHDVEHGTNDALGSLSGAYSAGKGWDACTGWGTPNGTELRKLI